MVLYPPASTACGEQSRFRSAFENNEISALAMVSWGANFVRTGLGMQLNAPPAVLVALLTAACQQGTPVWAHPWNYDAGAYTAHAEPPTPNPGEYSVLITPPHSPPPPPKASHPVCRPSLHLCVECHHVRPAERRPG
jgi:hypothetical protein